MKPGVWMAGGVVLSLLGTGVLAGEFPVAGSSASGRPGDRVFVELVYAYDNYDGQGTAFGAIAEDFQFEYQFAGMTFIPEQSTIDAFGSAQSLPNYTAALALFADGHGGSVWVNPDASASGPDYKGYALSFITDGTPQMRSGQVQLRVAFDILPAALPGRYAVSFTDLNLLVDENGVAFSYPAALQQLSVTVVPEPQIAWMLLPGLACVGWRARRRVHDED